MAHFSQVPAIRVNSNIFAQEGGLLQYLQEIKNLLEKNPEIFSDMIILEVARLLKLIELMIHH